MLRQNPTSINTCTVFLLIRKLKQFVYGVSGTRLPSYAFHRQQFSFLPCHQVKLVTGLTYRTGIAHMQGLLAKIRDIFNVESHKTALKQCGSQGFALDPEYFARQKDASISTFSISRYFLNLLISCSSSSTLCFNTQTSRISISLSIYFQVNKIPNNKLHLNLIYTKVKDL